MLDRASRALSRNRFQQHRLDFFMRCRAFWLDLSWRASADIVLLFHVSTLLITNISYLSISQRTASLCARPSGRLTSPITEPSRYHYPAIQRPKLQNLSCPRDAPKPILPPPVAPAITRTEVKQEPTHQPSHFITKSGTQPKHQQQKGSHVSCLSSGRASFTVPTLGAAPLCSETPISQGPHDWILLPLPMLRS